MPLFGPPTTKSPGTGTSLSKPTPSANKASLFSPSFLNKSTGTLKRPQGPQNSTNVPDKKNKTK
jgi:hypothetical protein